MPIDFDSFTLDRTTPLPFYYQIEQFLMEHIESGRLSVDECIPPETEMMGLFGVSRATIRQAIANLVNQGCLVRQKGRGTFVKAPKIQSETMQVLQSFQEEITKNNAVPKTKVLEFRVIPAIEEINKKLGLSEKEQLYLLRRTRYINGEAAFTFKTYLPLSKFPGLINIDFENQSLYQQLEECYGCRVNRVIRQIEVAHAGKEAAELLGIDKKDPVFKVSFTGFSNDTEPVEYSVTTYRGDRIEFTVEVKR